MLLLLFACAPGTDSVPTKNDSDTGIPVDLDGDGSPAQYDCDDANAAVHPAAPEVCDGLDNDCDGDIDENAADTTTWYVDADGDGYGDPDATEVACDKPDDASSSHDDCDDADAATHPDAVDVCGDGLDQDCDGTADDRCSFEGDLTDADAFATLSATPGATLPLAEGDLDGDGALDLVVGTSDVLGDLGFAWGPVAVGAAAVDAPWDTDDVTAVAAGDLDGDGVADLAGAFGGVGAYAGGGRPPMGAELWYADDVRPVTTVLVADVDGDAAADLVAGSSASGEVGAFVWARGPLAVDTAATWVTGEAVDDGVGAALASAGDTDGDGLPDLLVGGPGYSETDHSGRAWLLTDPGVTTVVDATTTLRGEKTGAAGTRVAGLGDLDGDGYADFAVAAPWWNQTDHTTDVGRVYVELGPVRSGTVDLEDATTIVSGSGKDDACGVAVAGGGDLDADGTPDVALTCGLDADGFVGVVFGPLDRGGVYASQADVTVAAPDAGFGGDLLTGGDLTGDGIDDLVVNLPSVGTAYVFAGEP